MYVSIIRIPAQPLEFESTFADCIHDGLDWDTQECLKKFFLLVASKGYECKGQENVYSKMISHCDVYIKIVIDVGVTRILFAGIEKPELWIL